MSSSVSVIVFVRPPAGYASAGLSCASPVAHRQLGLPHLRRSVNNTPRSSVSSVAPRRSFIIMTIPHSVGRLPTAKTARMLPQAWDEGRRACSQTAVQQGSSREIVDGSYDVTASLQESRTPINEPGLPDLMPRGGFPNTRRRV